MIFQRHTASLCNTCYREIPAVVEIHPVDVILRKKCPEHGEQSGIVERDAVFYSIVSGFASPSIYNGCFVDVTMTCQLRCSPCYAALVQRDPVGAYTKESILAEARLCAARGPIILTGGEPTLHPQLAEIITGIHGMGVGVELLSNGVKLADPDYFGEIIPLLSFKNGERTIANLNLSIHEEETDKWQEVIEICRLRNVRIESALIVIDSKESFQRALEIADSIKDVVISFRIKAATNIWAESGATKKVFVSDMLNWLEEFGAKPSIYTKNRHNKSTFVNATWKDLFLMLVSWYDVTNVDLLDIECPPWYRAHNGGIYNFVTTGLINEGISKGFVNGRKIGGTRVETAYSKQAALHQGKIMEGVVAV